jgi:hypothetical protein
MSQRFDDETAAHLRTYLTDIRILANEAAKRSRFAVLLGELFPGSKASTLFPADVEKLIRVDTAQGPKKIHGRDAVSPWSEWRRLSKSTTALLAASSPVTTRRISDAIEVEDEITTIANSQNARRIIAP